MGFVTGLGTEGCVCLGLAFLLIGAINNVFIKYKIQYTF